MKVTKLKIRNGENQTMEKKLKELLVCCFLSIVVIGVLCGQGETKVKVENGAVIIDGKYIEPPYTIEAKENGIWINGVLAEKRIPRKEQYRRAKKEAIRQKIQDEIYSEYYEKAENIGWERAREEIIQKLEKTKDVADSKIRRILMQKKNMIEIETLDDNFSIELATGSEVTKYVLEVAVSNKYRKWLNEKEEDGKSSSYKQLNEFLGSSPFCVGDL